MKLSWSAIVGCMAMVFASSLSSTSFADKEILNKGGQEAFMKLLSDSAAALQPSRPDLEASLVKLVEEMKNQDEMKKAAGERTESQKKEHRGARLKTMRDAAEALQESHPDLAAELIRAADERSKRAAEMEAKKENPNKAG